MGYKFFAVPNTVDIGSLRMPEFYLVRFCPALYLRHIGGLRS